MRYLFFFLSFQVLWAQNKILIDDFEEISSWGIIKSEGAEIQISQSEGFSGKGIKIDYNFKYGTGYCGIQKKLKLKLPDNFRFAFFIKALSPNNNFEIKFLDDSKENVWWMNNRNFQFPVDWEKFFVRKKNIQFAWGPTNNKNFEEFGFIEFTIASFTGGKGTIFLDELIFEEIVDSIPLEIIFYDHKFKRLFDKNYNTSIKLNRKDPVILNSFNKDFELGGIKIIWNDNLPKNLKVFSSIDSINWNELLNVNQITKRISYFQFKNLETKFLKFRVEASKDILINEIEFFDYSFSEDRNNIFFDLALKHHSRFLPEYFNRKAVYWTVVGTEGDEKEALIDSKGMIEVDKNSFSILPFIQSGRKVYTFQDFEITQNLEQNFLPIPVVSWENKNFKLQIKTFASGIPNKSTKLFIEYQLIQRNRSLKSNLHLAVIPFQVNPHYQFLNNPGGVADIYSIHLKPNSLSINDKKLFINKSDYKISTFEFNTNDALSAIIEQNFSGTPISNCKEKLGSALISYRLSSDTTKIRLIYDYYSTLNLQMDEKFFNAYFEEEKQKTIAFWLDRLNFTDIKGSQFLENLFNILKANLSYILINKDYSGIQPGSRSYERSWIRDGSLTSTALLRFGFDYEVQDFIRWYAKHIYENGKVPCVVDKRGPDPVDEHDSHGQFLYLLNTYFQFTNDTSLIRELFPLVKKVVQYIDSQTQLRKTEKYKADSLSAYYGLMPESISHEGYSAKPMHSYWDNFFIIRGLNDAVEIAAVLGMKDDYDYFKLLRNEFEKNLTFSIKKTIAMHKIDYISGCVELGDFDPTSTSIALFPCDQMANLPQFELRNTFEKYYQFFVKRLNENNFVNFTPYEIRNINSFLILGERDKAFELLHFMIKYQRPANWFHWAEVVWGDSTTPQFIGDMPHTWVGSDFINAFRNMFLMENRNDSTLVFLSGFNESFLDSNNSLEIKNLRTQSGILNLKVTKKNSKLYEIDLSGDKKLNQWKMCIKNLINNRPKEVLINGSKSYSIENNKIYFKDFPAKIIIKY